MPAFVSMTKAKAKDMSVSTSSLSFGDDDSDDDYGDDDGENDDMFDEDDDDVIQFSPSTPTRRIDTHKGQGLVQGLGQGLGSELLPATQSESRLGVGSKLGSKSAIGLGLSNLSDYTLLASHVWVDGIRDPGTGRYLVGGSVTHLSIHPLTHPIISPSLLTHLYHLYHVGHTPLLTRRVDRKTTHPMVDASGALIAGARPVGNTPSRYIIKHPLDIYQHTLS